jgi:hypothetical protein
MFGGVDLVSPKGSSGKFKDLWVFNPATREWTWMSGSTTQGSAGVYGTQGVASASNVPGARTAAQSWVDNNGNLWLFGGFDESGRFLDDLWEFNPSSKYWTWVSGSIYGNKFGHYGTQGVASSLNVPGGRGGAVTWTDKSGNFWLYGGSGWDDGNEAVDYGDLNDLWEFSPSTGQWTWVNGSPSAGIAPIYGTQGTAAPTNTPGGRHNAAGWIDGSGNFWLFGGIGYASGLFLNDLWEFNTVSKQWVWMGGSDTGGVYGTLGTPAASNIPGARGGDPNVTYIDPGGNAVAWTDSSGNFWLFGGDGYDSAAVSDGLLNDLWRYQP